MRVIIATRIFSPEPAAASFRLAALANALVAGGDTVRVFTGRVQDPRTTDVSRLVTVSRWPVLRDASGTVRGYVQYLSFDVPLFLRILLARRVDVVIAEPPPTTGVVVRFACAIRRIPYVYYASDIWTEALKSTSVPRAIIRTVSAVERLVLRGAATVVAVSDGVAASVQTIASGSRTEVATNGVDTSVFTLEGEAPQGSPYVVYAGTTSEWQGADIFVRAFAAIRPSMPEARLVFVGQGSAWAELKRLAATLGTADGVDFIDVVPPEEAASLLRGARASLVSLRPGQGYDFALPTKIFASVAVGTPVLFVGSESSTAAELVTSADLGKAVGFDQSVVAEAMQEALISIPSSSTREHLGEWARNNASSQSTGLRVADIVRNSVHPPSS